MIFWRSWGTSLAPVVLLGMIACHPGNVTTTSSNSVENLPTEAKDQRPAFPEQTRAPVVTTSTPIKLDTIVSSLSYPWGLDFLPDHRMIVTEKAGAIRLITLDGKVSDSIHGVPAVHFDRDGGLLDVTLAPDFPQTRLVYWVYSERYDSGFLAAVARGKLSTDEKRFESVEVIYRAKPAQHDTYHYGSRLLFDKDGRLFVCFGERFHTETRVLAQNKMFALGKIIRINEDGTACSSNPFYEEKDALPELWAIGFRDPQGMAFDPATGDLWVSDHGPRGGDELNLVLPGHNYGWPLISYGIEYEGTPVNGGKTQMQGMDQPVYYWDPAIAPGGMTFYDGRLIQEWKDDLFIAALRGKHLDRLVLKNNKVVGEERLLSELNQRIRTVKEGPDGALYVLTDSDPGAIIRIAPR